MNFKKIISFFGLVIIIVTIGRIAFAEEAAVALTEQVAITSNQQSVLIKETDMQWAWGEVTNLDVPANAITLKYLDYETDQEKEMVLLVNEKTIFENVKDFNALKLKDTLSIDYIVEADNKNIAKNINFENPEVNPVAALPGTVVPELAQPPVQLEASIDSSLAPAPVEPVSAPLELTSAPAESMQTPVVVDPALAAQGQAQ